MANFKVKNGLSVGTRYLQTGGADGAGTEGYALSNAEYDSISFSVASQSTAPRGFFFKPDGTKMYIANESNTVYEYTLSTAWDITSSSYLQSYSTASQTTEIKAVFLGSSGTKMYVVGSSSDSIHEYTLSTAWDVSTASYNQAFSVNSQDSAPTGVSFKADGTKMYVAGDSNNSVYEYTLSTAWDVSTASYIQALNISTQEANITDVFLSPDGTRLYISGYNGDEVNEYILSSAFDISTASHNEVFSVVAQAPLVTGVSFKTDGSKMYVVGSSSDTVHQYSTALLTQTLDLSTGSYFSFTPSGATTVSFTNAPASGKAIGFSVEINGDGSAITWPTSVKWPSGVAPTATASKEVYAFVTTDGGTSYYGKLAGSDIA